MEVCGGCKRQYTNEQDFLKGTTGWRLGDTGDLAFSCSCGNSIMLKKENSEWFSPDKVMNAKTASLFNKLVKKSQMPYIPTSVMELQILLSNENSSGDALAACAKKNPLLAAEILTQANNMRMSSNEKVTSLNHAITYVGRTTLSEIVLLAAVKSFKFKTKRMSSKDFWDQSRITGLIAEELCREHTKEIEGDRAYLAGSLCNIGKVVAAICDPDTVEKVFVTCETDKVPWSRAEDKVGAPSHCVLGELGCTLWGLPDYLQQAASKHHQMPGKTIDLPAIATFANQLVHVVMEKDHLIEEKIFDACLELFKMDDSKMMLFHQKMGEKVKSVA